MITFQLCNVEAGAQAPTIETRAFYKAFLQHVNRRNHKSRVRVKTVICGSKIIKTAYILPVDDQRIQHNDDNDNFFWEGANNG